MVGTPYSGGITSVVWRAFGGPLCVLGETNEMATVDAEGVRGFCRDFPVDDLEVIIQTVAGMIQEKDPERLSAILADL